MIAQDGAASSSRDHFVRHRLLIVDDVFSVREALHWAFEVVEDLVVVGQASDGAEALALAARLKPEVVILDIRLPGMDGYAVARQLSALPDPPVIILLSVHADAESRQRGAEAGAYAFVEKGKGWQVLIDLIRQALHGRKHAAS